MISLATNPALRLIETRLSKLRDPICEGLERIFTGALSPKFRAILKLRRAFYPFTAMVQGGFWSINKTWLARLSTSASFAQMIPQAGFDTEKIPRRFGPASEDGRRGGLHARLSSARALRIRGLAQVVYRLFRNFDQECQEDLVSGSCPSVEAKGMPSERIRNPLTGEFCFGAFGEF